MNGPERDWSAAVIVTAQIVVLLMGALVALLSSWGMAFPARLMRVVRGIMDESWGMVLAVVLRIVLGVSLVLAAPTTQFPVAFKLLGCLALIAAVSIPVMGRERLVSVLDWFYRLPTAVTRLWLMLGVLFGGFLLYGAGGTIS